MLTVRTYDDGEAFWRDVARPLSDRPVYNNVFVGVAYANRANAARDVLRAGVFDGEHVVLGALRTPSYRMSLADLGQGEASTAALAAQLAAQDVSLPGVTGDERLAKRFAEKWSAITGARPDSKPRHGWRQNLHQVLKVQAPANVAGRMRLARTAERDMLVDWQLRFAEDADLPANEREPGYVAQAIDEGFGEYVLWDVDGAPVAMARRRPVATMGVRIGAVFTPRDLRGRGYAAALTAALSQRVLDQGQFCCLFADAANAATNRLYQRLGYLKLATFADIVFADG